ncbi:hypothetical protein E2542_SST23022 [Spatholobus suberectus]|nr:hypothetical protein E2542_SST23022 [Spatholobus suberectus]
MLNKNSVLLEKILEQNPAPKKFSVNFDQSPYNHFINKYDTVSFAVNIMFNLGSFGILKIGTKHKWFNIVCTSVQNFKLFKFFTKILRVVQNQRTPELSHFLSSNCHQKHFASILIKKYDTVSYAFIMFNLGSSGVMKIVSIVL